MTLQVLTFPIRVENSFLKRYKIEVKGQLPFPIGLPSLTSDMGLRARAQNKTKEKLGRAISYSRIVVVPLIDNCNSPRYMYIQYVFVEESIYDSQRC